MEYLYHLENFIDVSYIKELIIAFFITIPIGWNREKETRSIGLRTFPLVSLSCCGYILNPSFKS